MFVEFSVSAVWLLNNQLLPGDVRLYDYSDGWLELSTEPTAFGQTALSFRASSPGFGLYAVGGMPISLAATGRSVE